MFKTEKELVAILKRNYNSICDWNINKFETEILEEVNLGFGVADLVISKIYTKDVRITELSYFDILIYKIIESSEMVSFEKIRNVTRANKNQINKSIEKLTIDSYINRENSVFDIKSSYKHMISKSIAIEAKLKNWKKALDQAFRYKWFAYKSYVVLDETNIKPAIRNLPDFIKCNVGLAQINTEGELTIHYNPIAKKPIDDKMRMLLNEQLKSKLFSA